MHGVTWLNTDPQFASARLRSIIPRDILKAQGLVTDGHDVVIAAKHGWSAITLRESTKRMVMDVCDDHFYGPWGAHYTLACKLADAVTCNSKTMQRIIKEATGKDAILIDDPYEDPELAPIQPKGETPWHGVLWFGHQSNLPDLEAVAKTIKYPLYIISNDNYSPEVLDRALKACRGTIIPTGLRQAKSANRAIRSIRYGKYPVCGMLPAHQELGLGLQDFQEQLEQAMTTDMSAEIMRLQDLIRDRFCPEKVAKDWYRVIYET